MRTIKQRIHRILVKINITSIFFFILSLISVTLAWFAFSNIVSNNMEISIKAWDININDETGEVSNKLSITLDDFHPGVDTYTKTLTINNNGDLPGLFTYHIKKIRILNEEYTISDEEKLLDQLSQEFPFSFNFSTDTNHLEPSKTLHLNITISWPLDSGDDNADSNWGNKTAEFIQQEQEKKNNNPSYEIKSCIELIVELNVKQYLEEENLSISDNNYRMGTNKIINLDNFTSCESTSDRCKNFFVIDKNNLEKDTTVTYLMSPKETTTQVTYNNLSSVQTNDLTAPSVSDILLALSNDVYNTQIKMSNTSNRILGKVDYLNRSDEIINKIVSQGGSIVFSKQQYQFLDTDSCYWLAQKYGTTKAFAIRRKDDKTLELYGEDINNTCKFVPAIKIKKESNLNE